MMCALWWSRGSMKENNEAESYFDKMSQQWDQDSMRNKIALNVARTIHKQLETLKNFKILDFGCGTGLLSFYFYPNAQKVDGVDTSEGMVDAFNKKAQENQYTNARARLFDIEKDTLPSGEFDIVMSSMVFHHLKNPEDVLEKIYAAVKPGGKIAIADLDEEDGTFHPLPAPEGEMSRLPTLMRKTGHFTLRGWKGFIITVLTVKVW